MAHDPVNLLNRYQARINDGGLQPDPYQERAIESLQMLADDILARPARRGMFGLKRKPQPIRGLYLYGPVGRGKSMVMDLFFASLPDGVKKRRVHFHDFMIGVHDFMHNRRLAASGKADNDVRDSALLAFADDLAKNVRVLCFDEFHVSNVADAMILGRLFTALFDQGVAVVMTSNRAPDDLYKGGLQRDRFLSFIDLLKNRMEVLPLSGPVDYRLQYLESSGVYFSPLGAAAHTWADQIFVHLTDGVEAHADTLEVRGRTVPVTQTARGVARFTFSELCEHPLGAEDYITIARTYHTILLEGVAKLGYDRRNEAVRLMTLVDALYDAGTRLIITADAPVDRLYHGHDHAFEFQRTVSRLTEMQSTDWFARTAPSVSEWRQNDTDRSDAKG
ncbi:cell division protein ZapE [Micavibrio aeruginosavorus]|uniref:cell division protein ZapE n=1 Tax=Micavibrio aeruginosavorus TaxID=349221 RepID=UPI003F4ACBC9